MIFNKPELRRLLYNEKSLDDFDIDSEGSIFNLFFEVLLTMDGTKVTDLNIEKKITDMFNDACYICTIAFIIKRPALKLGHFRELCSQTDKQVSNEARADEVMCMVYFLLKYFYERNNTTDSLVSVIDKDLRNRSRESYETYESFFNACSSCESRIPSGYFNQIILNPDQFYEDDGEVDWKDLTDTYNRTIIKDLVNCWKDAIQRDIVIDDMVNEVESDYYYTREDGYPVIIFPGQSREEMLDYLDSLRLSDKGVENKRKRAQLKIEEKQKTYSLDDPRIHSFQVPFLLHDENNDTIITRTAKEINEGRMNPFKVNWAEVTLYDTMFVTELLEIIHSDYIIDVAQAIDDEEARRRQEDGQYTDVASDYYGTGQGNANFYSYMINREEDDYEEVVATAIAQGILNNRIKAEEYQQKLEKRKLNVSNKSKGNQNKIIRQAIEALMQETYTNSKGREEQLFKKKNHWQAIYRILVDKKVCGNGDYMGFQSFINDVNPRVVNAQFSLSSLQQISDTPFYKRFDVWEYDPIISRTRTPYDRMYEIARRFKEIIENLGLK